MVERLNTYYVVRGRAQFLVGEGLMLQSFSEMLASRDTLLGFRGEKVSPDRSNQVEPPIGNAAEVHNVVRSRRCDKLQKLIYPPHASPHSRTLQSYDSLKGRPSSRPELGSSCAAREPAHSVGVCLGRSREPPPRGRRRADLPRRLSGGLSAHPECVGDQPREVRQSLGPGPTGAYGPQCRRPRKNTTSASIERH